MSNEIKFGSLAIDKLMFGSTEIDKVYLGSNLIYESMEQLATPTNLSITDTTLSFDEVENAESYEVFADGNSIGTYNV